MTGKVMDEALKTLRRRRRTRRFKKPDRKVVGFL